MNSNQHTARQWGVGLGMAIGAGMAAAMIGMTGAPAAHADAGSAATDLGLLDSAAADFTEAINVLTNTPGVVVIDLSGLNVPDIINQFEAIQTPLLSSDNSSLSGLGDFLFDGPDQQLAHAGDVFLTAAQAFAADPSPTAGLGISSAGFQYTDTLLFESLYPNGVGAVIDQLLGLGGFDTAAGSAADVGAAGSAGADLAAGFGLPF